VWAPRERSFEVNGVRVHALEDGPRDGPLVVLLHGFPEWSGAWHAQAPALASAGYHVVAPDQRGYGRSDKPRGTRAYTRDALADDVVGIGDACGADTLSLVGHDWGGAVAWWTALRHAERVRRLAVLNAPHPSAFDRVIRRNPRQLARSWYMFAFQLPVLPEWWLARGGMRAAFDALARSSRPGTFGHADQAGYREAWSQPGAWTGMIAWYRAAFRHPASPVSARVRMPTLVLWGDADAFLLPELASLSLRFCDRGRLVRLAGATHWLQHEEPARVNEELLQFLAEP
jgi:pimeloyl-ACP methyl ester carboxylesterase